MTRTRWSAYNELAWVETIVAPPGEYAEETEHCCGLIEAQARIPVKTLLHLGCGAGGNDFTFKKRFKVTGVDVSPGMLAIARKRNPDVVYIEGDMRTVRLRDRFDAVAIPDSIGYMTARGDLRRAVETSRRHLKPGGVLLIVALVREDFRENNFVYTGSGKGVRVTIFENNGSAGPGKTTYDAVIVYLVRRGAKVEARTERHVQGLFPLAAWLATLRAAGFDVRRTKIGHAYDRFLQGDGKYVQRVFVCRMPLPPGSRAARAGVRNSRGK
ncbi:MAG: class I SAM-dependent methyltransferase [Candidatus Aminicenantes bacterium]|nr:class I SAM-dependent methyltransferase [Candidatus Aminicenantes bacterium]